MGPSELDEDACDHFWPPNSSEAEARELEQGTAEGERSLAEVLAAPSRAAWQLRARADGGGDGDGDGDNGHKGLMPVVTGCEAPTLQLRTDSDGRVAMGL